MAGLLNTKAQDTSAKSLTNPVLQKIESGIESQLTPKNKTQYLSFVTAGMNVMFSNQSGQRVLNKLKTSTDIVSDVSQGIANVIAVIFNEASTNINAQQVQELIAGAIPASVTLMTQAFDAYEKLTGQIVSEQMAADATKYTTRAVLAKFKITQDKMKQVITAKQQNKV